MYTSRALKTVANPLLPSVFSYPSIAYHITIGLRPILWTLSLLLVGLNSVVIPELLVVRIQSLGSSSCHPRL